MNVGKKHSSRLHIYRTCQVCRNHHRHFFEGFFFYTRGRRRGDTQLRRHLLFGDSVDERSREELELELAS